MNIQRGQRGKLDGQFDLNSAIEVNMRTNGPAVYDYCCFGVDGEDKLSDDSYMIFYNQTSSPQNEITFQPQQNSALFNLSLVRLPERIQKLVFTVSIDGSGTMGQISDFEVSISQNGREPIVLALKGTDFTQEKAIISFEIYNKNGWRYSAVASGFNGGLGDLLRNYGGEEVKSDDAPANNTHVQAEPVKQPVPVQPVVAEQPSIQPIQLSDLGEMPGIPEPPKAQPVPQSAPQGKVSLRKLEKSPISLKKNEKVELRKPNDERLERVYIGLGWDAAKRGKNIDCDSSVFMCSNGRLCSERDVISFMNLRHDSGSVIHHGDNLTGQGAGDDETIEIDLTRVPAKYDRIVIVVNIFMAKAKKQHFGNIVNCYMRIYDQKSAEMCSYVLSNSSEYDNKTAMIFGELTRYGDSWVFHSIGEGTMSRDLLELEDMFK